MSELVKKFECLHENFVDAATKYRKILNGSRDIASAKSAFVHARDEIMAFYGQADGDSYFNSDGYFRLIRQYVERTNQEFSAKESELAAVVP